MTLEEYRVQLLERLRRCSSPLVARSIVIEGEVVLSQADLSDATRRAFWLALRDQLLTLAENCVTPKSALRDSLHALAIAAASRVITEMLDQLGHKKDAPN